MNKIRDMKTGDIIKHVNPYDKKEMYYGILKQLSFGHNGNFCDMTVLWFHPDIRETTHNIRLGIEERESERIYFKVEE
jgi:hypothetical protein